MNTINAVQSAVKGKSPIVAIPVEGHAPFCIRAKLLKGALKGVTVQSAEVERTEHEAFPSLGGQMRYSDGRGEYVKFEGPLNRIVTVHFALRITGRAGYVRTSCRIAPLNRLTALKELSAWSDKEREKQKRTKILAPKPAIKSDRAKLAKYILTHIDGDDARTFFIRVKDSIKEVRGLAIAMQSFPDLKFFIHATRDHEGVATDWTVTEVSSGFAANKLVNSTPLKAIEEAEVNLATANKQVLIANVLKNQIPQTTATA